MDPVLRQYLISLGLNPNASEGEAKTFLSALTAEQKAAAPTPAPQNANGGVNVTVNIPANEPAAPAVALAAKPTAPPPTPDLIALETKRVGDIKALSTLYGLSDDFVRTQIAAKADLPAVQAAALTALSAKNPPVKDVAINVGVDQNRASLAPAMTDAIMLRAGRDRLYEFNALGAVRDEKGNVNLRRAHDRATQFRGLPLLDMFRHYLQAIGVNDAFYLSKPRLADLLSPREFRRAYPSIALSESTSDFTSILADTINKTLRMAYLDAPRTWNVWARRTSNDDFKTITRAALSESPDMTVRNEGHGIDYVTLTDSKETYALAEYISGIKLTRKAVINDDLDAFSRIPMLQATAAARKEDDVAYGIITANANLADGGALFNSTAFTVGGTGHANYVSSGGVPSVAQLAATEKLMMKQKGPKGAARLEIRPRYMLVPSSIYRTSQQVVSSTVDPAKNNAAINPFFNEGLVLVPSARLDDASATAWYLLADYNQVDTIEVCFLTGEEEPQLKQETDFDTDDVKFAIRHTVAAKAIDFRGMAKNAGA